MPFYVGAGAGALAIAVLASGHQLLAGADRRLATDEQPHAGEPDLAAAEVAEVETDGTGEAGVIERAESHHPAR